MIFFALFIIAKSFVQVSWHAPFLSGGGYCSEAISFVLPLSQMADLSLHIEQHGDAFNVGFIEGLPMSTQEVLGNLFQNQLATDKPVVAICHSEVSRCFFNCSR
jgi:hypothetical protein